MHCSQEVLEAVKPKKTKLGTPSESSSQLVTDASLVHENEIHLTVEIEVVSFPY